MEISVLKMRLDNLIIVSKKKIQFQIVSIQSIDHYYTYRISSELQYTEK